MNKKSIIVFLLIFLSAMVLFAQETKQVDVRYIQEKAAPYESIILQGNITAQLDWDEFILSDSTGAVKLELEGPAKYDVNHQALMGSTVRVYGVVDKEHQWDKAEVKVLKMRVVGAGNNTNVQNVSPSSAQKETAPAANSTGDINMEGRDDLAEAFENAYGNGQNAPGANIPDNF